MDYFNSLPSQWVIGVALILHLLAVVIWIGGMFFAYNILRPACAEMATPVRLRLWMASLRGFFKWVWIAAIVLPTSGIALMLKMYGGMGAAPWPMHAMLAIGMLMIVLFVIAFFGPWRSLQRGVLHTDWPAADSGLKGVRIIVAMNLHLGLLTIALAAAGRSGLLA